METILPGGENKPQEGNVYNWSSYKWCEGSASTLTKYCTLSSYGTVDYKATLDPADDAVRHNWGGVWRMPTTIEQKELETNCYWVRTSSYNGSGIAGYIIYAAKSSSDKGKVQYNTSSSGYSLSDTHIFLPATGMFYNYKFVGGEHGRYWSSSLNGAYNNAFDIYFMSNHRSGRSYDGRCNGQTIRAVCE